MTGVHRAYTAGTQGMQRQDDQFELEPDATAPSVLIVNLSLGNERRSFQFVPSAWLVCSIGSPIVMASCFS
ncbi:hypothetical protein [Paracoccus aminovorans]|uniref:hypothetical protein n=1 Tax=Paracoccus aminovorans TaxID=34004 RepID=UPI001C12B47A|nr:hypothetical protein [Paracoccus aminovorans]